MRREDDDHDHDHDHHDHDHDHERGPRAVDRGARPTKYEVETVTFTLRSFSNSRVECKEAFYF